MHTIQELLDEKGSRVWSIHPDASVYEAIAMMAEHHIGVLLVIDDTGPVGLFSERDYARDVALRGRSSRLTPVRDVMTRGVIYAGPDQTLEEAMALMTDKRLRHLPVMDDGQVLGLISIGDLVKCIITEKAFVIEQLERHLDT